MQQILNILLITLYSLMLPQLGGKQIYLPLKPNNTDQRSPYLLQFKVFEQRLKRQEKFLKCPNYISRPKKTKSKNQEDYLEITKSILNKKQNICIFQDVPCDTEPSIDTKEYNQILAAKTRQLFIRKSRKNKNLDRSLRDQALTQLAENSAYDSSRIKSEATTHLMRLQKSKNSDISFIGYKRNKKTMIDQGFKKIWGII